jgi:hypothetical protein
MMQHGPKGWAVGARGSITGVAGFDHIGGDVYYKPNRLGFIVGDKTTLPEGIITPEGQTASPKEVKTAKMPGAALHALFAFLEYDLKEKQFDGQGELGITIPVLEGNTITGAGVFTIEKNALSNLDAMVAADLRLPPSNPIVMGPVKGTIKGENGKLGGTIKGDLAINSSPMTEKGPKKVGKPKGESSKDEDISLVRFYLSVDQDSGTTGYVRQTGATTLGGFFKIEGLNIDINSSMSVQDTVKGIDKLGGSPSKNLKEVSGKIAQAGIARRTNVKGKGEISAGTGGRLSGGLSLNYGEKGFDKSKGFISLGDAPGKKGKTGIYGKVQGEYTPETGFALTSGELVANISKGLQAKGSLARTEGKDMEESGLEANLEVDAKLFDGAQEYTKVLYSASVQPTWPIIPLVFSLYGDAGVELKVKYGLKPFLLTGKANVMGIDLAEGTFTSAFVHIEKKRSTKSKPTGEASAEFLGQPYLGIGAALATPALAGVSGGLTFPISAKASVNPELDTNVIYDKEGKLKGNLKVDFPLVLTVRMGVKPYVKGTALAGLIKLNYEPSEPLEEVDLMEPKVMSMLRLDLGNLEDDKKGAQDIAPDSGKDLKPASTNMAKEHKEESEPVESGGVKKLPDREGEGQPKSKDDEPSAPIGFAGVVKVFKAGFEPVVKGAKAVYNKVTQVAKKLGELAGKGAEALGTTAKAVGSALSEAGSWIVSWFSSNPDTALKEVKKAKDLTEVPKVEKYPLFEMRDWNNYAGWRLKLLQMEGDRSIYSSQQLLHNFHRMRLTGYEQFLPVDPLESRFAPPQVYSGSFRPKPGRTYFPSITTIE